MGEKSVTTAIKAGVLSVFLSGAYAENTLVTLETRLLLLSNCEWL